MLPGRRVRITMQIGGGEEVTMWQGCLESISPTVGAVVGISTAELLAYGALAHRSLQGQVSVPMHTDITTGAAIVEVLDQAQFPAGERVLDPGQGTMSRWWDQGTAIQALRDLEETEAGFLRETKDGKIAFEDRAHRLAGPHTVSQATYGGGSLVLWNPQQGDSTKGIFNHIEAAVRSFDVSEEMILWTLSGRRLRSLRVQRSPSRGSSPIQQAPADTSRFPNGRRPTIRPTAKVILAFLKREVEEKWRDPSGQPYLTLEQHIHLLAAVADEMWTQLAKTLPVELLQLIAETTSEEFQIPLQRRVQIVERVKAHVLLPAGAALRADHRAFDHDEFLDYFLAVRICELLKSGNKSNLRRFLERHSLPVMSAKWTAVIEPWEATQVRSIIDTLSQMVSSELRSTYLKQNAGLLAARLAGFVKDVSDLNFESMYFEGDDWRGTSLSGAKFKACVFSGIDFSDLRWVGCRVYRMPSSVPYDQRNNAV